MKKVNYLLLCFILSVVVLSGCKSDDGGDTPNPEQEALNMLQGTWKVTSATRDSNPLGDYSDFTINISNKTITTVSGAPSGSIFPTGTFTFKGTDYKTITVNDGDQGPIDVSTVGSNATVLSTSFSLDEDGKNNSSKVLLLDGKYEFKFAKQ